MSWVRLDDRVLTHPKIIALGRGSRWVWVAGLVWSSEHRTDGALPGAVLHSLQATRRDARALVDVGLWTPDGAGWAIHDFGDYQPLNGELSRKRSEAGRKGAQARWHPDDNPMAGAMPNA